MSTSSDKDAKVTQDVLDKLYAGLQALAERQKYIHITDQAKNSWRAVVAYKAGGLGDSEENNKEIKQANKDAEPEIQQPRKGNFPERQAKLQFHPPHQTTLGMAQCGPPTTATAHATATSP